MAQVRVIDASADAVLLDAYHETTPMAYNIASGTVTSYVPIPFGTRSIQLRAAGSGHILTTHSESFLPGGAYTVLATDITDTLQDIVLRDQTQPAPSGHTALRFLHQSAYTGAVDLYLVAAGTALSAAPPVLTNVSPGTGSGYIDVAAGTYTLVAMQTGLSPSAKDHNLYTGAAVSYASGSVKTIVLLDSQLGATPGLQVVFAKDCESKE